jgi:hypothetical protein
VRLTQPLPLSRRILALVALLVPLSVTAASAQRVANITLAWDPSPEPIAGYRVHVGTRSRDYDDTIEIGQQTVFIYPALTGRRYYFAVSAYSASGASSPMSAEVTTIAGSNFVPIPGIGETPPPDDGSATGQSTLQPTNRRQMSCASDSGCYAARVRVSSRARISSLSAADDGSLLWVEEGRALWLLAAGAEAARVLLRAPPDTDIADAVAAPHFAADRRVTVGVIQPARGGKRELALTRYRISDAGLAEALAVATFPAEGEGTPRLAIDPAGRVYVAMPLGADRSDPYVGMILRFNQDGTVPSGQRAASPILAQGYQHPTMLAADTRQLWAAGMHDAWTHRLSRIALDATAVDAWPLAPEPVDGARTMARSGAVIASTHGSEDSRDGEFSVVAYLDADRSLHLVDRQSGADRRFDLDALAGLSSPTAVTFDALGRVYVAARQPDGWFSVLELSRSR